MLSLPTLSDYTTMINEAIAAAVPAEKNIICEAMNYSLKNGGKRIRPTLTLEFCRVCGGDIDSAMPFAIAVEMIHTYSLIHDDLPCMDDDDLRRGKPSCHVSFGEAYALLAGDALLTLAFGTLMKAKLPDAQKTRACLTLAAAAGYAGMIGGQMLDLQNEGREVDADILKQTDNLKTVEMIKAACVLGCIAAGAGDDELEAARKYADGIGLAFQIRDDILDETSDTRTLGKPVGSDRENDKSTYVALLGLDSAQNLVTALTQGAVQALTVFGDSAGFLATLAQQLATREK